MTGTTNSDDSSTDTDEYSENTDDEVTEVTIRRDSRGWSVVSTTDDVVCDVGYVISLGRRQRVTLKTEVGPPDESDTEDE